MSAGNPRAKLPLKAVAAFVGLSLCLLTPMETETAIANGDTRTISLYHSHTGESITATFRVNGEYDSATLQKLNWFLRDWRTDEPTKMDARLFEVIWETYRETGSTQPITVLSAYRSPETNAMLRRRSRAVAEHSQHMLGKAMDMHYTDVPMSRVREIGMRLQRGGVGYYPANGFVHLDVGSVRAWPRMSYDQLARLFPDGKTVHLPTNGQPLARYEEARAEIESRGGSYAPSLAQVKSKGFFATLFGGGSDDEEENVPAARGRSRVASLGTATGIGPSSTNGEDAGPAAFFAADAARRDGRFAGSRTAIPTRVTVPDLAPAPAPVVVASARTEPVRTEAPRETLRLTPGPELASLSNAPLPPRRPTDMVVVATLADGSPVPLPPVRPTELRLASAVIPTARPTELPPVILRGTSSDTASSASGPALPAAALAYAPMNAVDAPVPPARTTRTAARKLPLVAARLDRSNYRALTASASITAIEPTALGQGLPSTRSATRSEINQLLFSTTGTGAQQFGSIPQAPDHAAFVTMAALPPQGMDPMVTSSIAPRVN